MSALRHTPLTRWHQDHGAKIVPFAGYEMPLRYGSQVGEHHAVRRAAGLFDVSHMGEFLVRGAEALVFLQGLTPNNVERLPDGRAHYSALLDPGGGFLDDMLIYRRSATDFMLVVNAATRQADWDWIRDHASAFDDVRLEDVSDELALLALQGPRAEAILTPHIDADLGQLRYYSFLDARVFDVDMVLSRTGYTGEDGFELYLPADDALAVWEALLEAGAGHSLEPVGLAARDTLRLEAGMMLSGQDIGPDVSPLEAGLQWMVKLKKGDFVGREALLRQKESGLSRRLVGFELDGRAIARHGQLLKVEGLDDVRGTVRSGSWSPTLERAIGIALVEGTDPFVVTDESLTLDIRGRSVLGRITQLPFYRRAGS